MTVIRVIFGFQATDSKPTTLRVAGDIGGPPMRILSRSSNQTASYDCVDDVWSAELAAGDYVVSLEIDEWVAGDVSIHAELSTGQAEPLYVYYGPLPERTTSVGLAAWTSSELHVNPPTSSVIGDPKDPWPPPPPPPRSLLSLASESWFTTQLSAASALIDTKCASPDAL